MASDLSVKFCGVKFCNPFVLASGILGITAASWRNVVRNGAGGITTKTLWLREHKGHRNPVMVANEHYMINAVGVPDAGIEKAREEIGNYLGARGRGPAPLIASITAGSVSEFGEIAAEIAKLGPDIIEVNISCPNVENEFGKPFACVPADAAAVTKIVKEAVKSAGKSRFGDKRAGGLCSKRLGNVRRTIPIAVKLSPNVENIVTIAKAVVDAGADALTVMNTLGPGMAIDIETRAPVLANKVGGVSGPMLKPIAVKHIYDIRRALPDTPIIGTGGILNGRDAIEMMMAGATLVGIGTGVYYRGAEIFAKAEKEMKKWCAENKVKKIADIINAAHLSS